MSDYTVTEGSETPLTDKYIKEKKQTEAEVKRLEDYKKEYREASDYWSEQREREAQELRFQLPGMQWDDASKAQRSGGMQGGQVTPARPMLSISKLDQPIQLVLNQARTAHFGVNIKPVSEKATDDTAEVMQGIYRAIEQDSDAPAAQARLWGLDRATKVGWGAYRVNTVWDDDTPEKGDQKIVIERILYQEQVVFDPSATKPDFSDGEFAYVSAWVPLKTFRRLYPNASLASESDRTFADYAKEEPDWVRGDGNSKAVLVCERFGKIHKIEKDPYGLGKEDPSRARDIDKVSVKWCKMTCSEILEEQDWNGKWIPIIPAIGRELQPIDSKRYWVGMIGPSMDGQKLYNFAASTLVERMALEPKVPFLGYAGQFETDKSKWEQINTRNFPYVESDVVTVDGKPAPLPQRMQIDQSGMSLAMMALQEADSFIQSTTSTYDPSLGRTNPRDKSGIAIQRLQDQSDAGTSHYLSSLADVSMLYEAKVVLDLIPQIYDREGRIVRILGGEDESRSVMLNAPYRMNPDGRPIPAVPPGMPPQGMPPMGGMPPGMPPQGPPMPPGGPNGGPPIGMPGQPSQPPPKLHNLKEGSYSISVSIGKSYQTRLEQGQTELGEMLPNLPPELQIALLPTYLSFRDFPGSKEVAEIMKKFRDRTIPGLGDDGKDGQPTVEQLQGKISAMEQAGQKLQDQLKQASQALETDQAKQQAQIQQAQIKAQTDIQLAQINNAAKIEIARISAAKEAANQEAQAQEELLSTGLKIKADAQQNEMDRQHEVGVELIKHAHAVQQLQTGQAHEQGMAQADQQHEAQQTAAGQAHDASQADADRDAAKEQAETAAMQKSEGE
jgi:hypothetical protein